MAYSLLLWIIDIVICVLLFALFQRRIVRGFGKCYAITLFSSLICVFVGFFMVMIAPDATFTRLFVAFPIVFGVCTIPLNLMEIKKGNPVADQEEMDQKLEDFYRKCASYHILSADDLSDQGNLQRAQLLLKKIGLSTAEPAEVAELLERGRSFAQPKDDKAREKRLAELRARESETYAQLTHYCGLHGRDKPITMLNDLADRLTARANGTSMIPMKKESDGAVMAGVASGIGGPIPALMSLSNTARSNEAVRQQNKATAALNSISAMALLSLMEDASRYREESQKRELKLIAEMPTEEVFQHVTFQEVSVHTSETGTVSVSAWALVEKGFSIFENLPAFVDGSVAAEIYDGETKIGSAPMVFPAMGSMNYHLLSSSRNGFSLLKTSTDKPVKLEGMCLFCGTPGKEYAAKIVPVDLWAMEQ